MRYFILMHVLLGVGAAMAPASPQVFSPGVISSGAHDSAPAFSPDGQQVFLGRSTPAASAILVSRRILRGWSEPELAPFSGEWLDMEPAMSPDGSYLIFVSNRPVVAGGAPVDGLSNGKSQPGKGGNLWRVNRVDESWSEPSHLPAVINSGGSIYAPSIATDGTLYFMKPSAGTGRFQLFRAKPSADGYEAPQPLAFSNGSTTDVDPAVAPDQSFIVFGSGRRAGADIDLYISHRKASDWDTPIYLGEPLNSRTSDAEPRLASDGSTLYFSSERLVPVANPINRADAAQVVADMSGWNNGLYNIWKVDLAPLLALSPHGADVTAPTPVDEARNAETAPQTREIETLADVLTTDYVLPQVGTRYAALLHANLANGSYDSLTTAEALGAKVTDDLQLVHPDGHLRIGPKESFGRPRKLPADSPASTRASGPPGLEEVRMMGGCRLSSIQSFPGRTGVGITRAPIPDR